MRTAWYTTTRAPNAGSASAGPRAALLLAAALLMLSATPAAGQSTRGNTVWSATLTVNSGNALSPAVTALGCSDYETDAGDLANCSGVGGKLTNVTFTYANTNYAVKELFYISTENHFRLQLDKVVPDYRGNLAYILARHFFSLKKPL